MLYLKRWVKSIALCDSEPTHYDPLMKREGVFMSNDVKVLTVHCETAEEHFGKADVPISYLGEVSVRWLRSRVGEKVLETGSREYQREKVASTEWKQDLMKTILCSPYARIPQIHIRVINTPAGLRYEIIDGQQRVTSILDFLNKQYNLSDKLKTYNNTDVGGLDVSTLEAMYPNIYNEILNYRITVIWYENLDDAMVSELFVKVLNNQNNLNAQEIRNAIRGLISEWIRNTARFEPHDIFSRITKSKKKTTETALEYIPSLKLKGRMEVDEWLSQLIYMYEKGLKDGVTSQKALTSWIQDSQLPGNWGAIDSPKFKSYQKKWNAFLDYSLNMVKSVPKNYTSKITPMNLQLLVLYAWELENKRSYRIQDRKSFATAYYDTIAKWSDTQKKVYMKWHQVLNKRQMPPMKELFGGKNPNAIQTIMWILDREIDQEEKNGFDWGIVKLDPRSSFSREDIIKKWKEQNHKCFYTGRPLTEDELVGDHFIPRSSGVEKGGVTEYSNLVVTDRATNQKKLTIDGHTFIKMLKGET